VRLWGRRNYFLVALVAEGGWQIKWGTKQRALGGPGQVQAASEKFSVAPRLG
jgi:hypothetical protein